MTVFFCPTQPYLAKNVGTSVDHINFIWTGRSVGFCLTSVVMALVFKKYCTKTWQKMMCLAAAEIITGIFVSLTPWADSFPLLIGIVTIFGMSLGLFDTADNSLMVYMFGPKKSRPFTQSVHAFVGVGFVLGSVWCSHSCQIAMQGIALSFQGRARMRQLTLSTHTRSWLAYRASTGLLSLLGCGTF